MTTYKIYVQEPGGSTEGSAFVVAKGIVATAFHVVGDCKSGTWRGDAEEDVVYELFADARRVPLRPFAGKPRADVA